MCVVVIRLPIGCGNIVFIL